MTTVQEGQIAIVTAGIAAVLTIGLIGFVAIRAELMSSRLKRIEVMLRSLVDDRLGLKPTGHQ